MHFDTKRGHVLVTQKACLGWFYDGYQFFSLAHKKSCCPDIEIQSNKLLVCKMLRSNLFTY